MAPMQSLLENESVHFPEKLNPSKEGRKDPFLKTNENGEPVFRS